MKIVVPKNQLQRMRETNFRKPRKAKAGNFLPGIGWPDLVEMFREKLEAEIEKELAASTATFSITLTAPEFIGWTGAIKIDGDIPEDTEFFKPNKHSNAMRFRLDSNRAAPLTREVTFIIRFPRQPGVALIESLYPGEDVGHLRGDITKRENVVFFGFEHIGEALVDA